MKLFLATLVAGAILTIPGVASADRSAVWAEATVDLSDQRLIITDTTGAIVRTWRVSTGAAETPTPTGRFKVTSKSSRTFVAGNPRVTMRYMTRFNGGIGFHSIPRLDGTPLTTPLGTKAVSHGCVRLSDKNARELFHKLPVGATVTVRP